MLREIGDNKQILLSLLSKYSFVLDIWPGEANFVLVRVKDAKAMLAHCAAHGVILRGYAGDPALLDCIRISVGSKPDLSALDQALGRWQKEQP